ESMEGAMVITTGMTFPEYRTGDLTSSGRTIAEVLDIDHMEVMARIVESERGNVNPGQTVEVRVDTQPGRVYSGKVKTISGQASRGGMFGPPTGPSRNFDVAIELDNLDGSLRPGVTTRVTIHGEEVKGALLLPRQALFEKDGETIVYVRDAAGFTPRKVKVTHRTESRIALEGLQENEEVALVNPEGQGSTQSAPSKAAPAGPLTPKKGGR
ncbi:MAG TPA: efflux RND transporter periplasmic adaptor subunit, partial [Desulfurivibrionaceae bacterium]|nr:efflux RND transporter periplasmic adaptor subunit [Desulfurivibrionaceae bacterium]